MTLTINGLVERDKITHFVFNKNIKFWKVIVLLEKLNEIEGKEINQMLIFNFLLCQIKVHWLNKFDSTHITEIKLWTIINFELIVNVFVSVEELCKAQNDNITRNWAIYKEMRLVFVDIVRSFIKYVQLRDAVWFLDTQE